MQKQLEALGVKTVFSTVYPADASNFQTTASAIAAKKPDLIAQGAVFEDGVGLVRSLKQVGYSPKMLFQTSAPSNAGQYSDGIGEANTEGVFYTVSWNEKATDPEERRVREGLRRQAFDNETPAEDAADAFAAAEVLRRPREKVGSLDQTKIADWLHAQRDVDHPRTADAGTRRVLRRTTSCSAQWQNGEVQIVPARHRTAVTTPRTWSTPDARLELAPARRTTRQDSVDHGPSCSRRSSSDCSSAACTR